MSLDEHDTTELDAALAVLRDAIKHSLDRGMTIDQIAEELGLPSVEVQALMARRVSD